MSLQEMSQDKRTLVIKCLVRCDALSAGNLEPLPLFSGTDFLGPSALGGSGLGSVSERHCVWFGS